MTRKKDTVVIRLRKETIDMLKIYTNPANNFNDIIERFLQLDDLLQRRKRKFKLSEYEYHGLLWRLGWLIKSI